MSELGRDLDRITTNAAESRLAKQFIEGFRLTDGKPFAFIELTGLWIHAQSRLPEVAKEIHATGVVPYLGGDCTAADGYAVHLFDSRLGLRKEVEGK